MDLLSLVAAFMLSVGSPTFVVNYYNHTPTGVEVDVQSTTDPVHRYLVLLTKDGVAQSLEVPLDDTQCDKEKDDAAPPHP